MSLPLPAEAGSPPATAAGRPAAGRSAGARIEVDGLVWRPFGRAAPVLPGLDLTILPGERVLLAGPSGSGKSTLLRALAGVLTTTESGDLSGAVRVDGHDPGDGGTHVGLLVQDPADAAVAGRVGRDVAFGPENLGLPRDRIWSTVRDTLAAVRFPYGADHPVHALSGGEAQRLALAGVLALGPRLVLLDEPTAMLDPRAAEAVRRSVTDAAREAGATMVIVEHRLGPWVEDVDRLVVLDASGRVAADGPVAATLHAQAADLAAHGVWVPGVEPPRPLPVPPWLCAPTVPAPVPPTVPAPVPATAGEAGPVAVRAEAVGVVRRPAVGLTAARTSPPPTVALSEVDVAVRAGEVLAVVGASGAGKSTLTALLAGVDSPTSGAVTAGDWLRGGAGPAPGGWSSPELARRVGWVPQQAELGGRLAHGARGRPEHQSGPRAGRRHRAGPRRRPAAGARSGLPRRRRPAPPLRRRDAPARARRGRRPRARPAGARRAHGGSGPAHLVGRRRRRRGGPVGGCRRGPRHPRPAAGRARRPDRPAGAGTRRPGALGRAPRRCRSPRRPRTSPAGPSASPVPAVRSRCSARRRCCCSARCSCATCRSRSPGPVSSCCWRRWSSGGAGPRCAGWLPACSPCSRWPSPTGCSARVTTSPPAPRPVCGSRSSCCPGCCSRPASTRSRSATTSASGCTCPRGRSSRRSPRCSGSRAWTPSGTSCAVPAGSAAWTVGARRWPGPGRSRPSPSACSCSRCARPGGWRWRWRRAASPRRSRRDGGARGPSRPRGCAPTP